MLTVREITAEEWPHLAAGFHDLGFEQTRTYAAAAAHRIGAKTKFLALEDGDRTIAAACLRVKKLPGFGRGIAWVASGPLIKPVGGPEGDARAILAALKAYVCDRQGHILRLRFSIFAGLNPTALAVVAADLGFTAIDRTAAYHTVLIDLTQGEETLMRGLHGKWRNALRNALKNGIELDRGPLSEFKDRFETLYNVVQTAKGFEANIPPEFYYALEGSDFTHDVLIARQGDTDLAAITIGRAGRAMVYLFGATPDAGRRLNAGYFVMWKAILAGLAEGVEVFDLGGIDEASNPNVTRFKRRTGGVEVSAVGPFQALPAGLLPRLILTAETLRGRLKR